MPPIAPVNTPIKLARSGGISIITATRVPAMIIIAITTGLGGGSLRDLLLNREVFWVADQVFFIASLLSAIFIFITARIFAIPQKLFLIMAKPQKRMTQ
jgi:uncharacterized membrane protein YeiH